VTGNNTFLDFNNLTRWYELIINNRKYESLFLDKFFQNRWIIFQKWTKKNVQNSKTLKPF
jgi:hypothetical protein